MKKVKELTPRGTHENLEATIKRINNWYVGWSNYFNMTQYPSQLSMVEAHKATIEIANSEPTEKSP